MEQDDTLRIAVLGAGPIGLEAALYGRYLGYDVRIFAVEEVCAAVEKLSSAAMGAPFRQNCSPLGLAALDAHDANYVHPPAEQILTGRQWLDGYLSPLSGTDLIVDSLRLRHAVLAVEYVASDETYEVRVRNDQGAEQTEVVDYVVDPRALACVGFPESQEAITMATFAARDTEDYFAVAAETFRGGLEQIRQIFAKMGERDDLDIYMTLNRFEL